MKEEPDKIGREELKELIAEIMTEVIKKNTPKTNLVELYGVKVQSDDVDLFGVANVFQQIVDLNKELINQRTKDSKLNGKDFYG